MPDDDAPRRRSNSISADLVFDQLTKLNNYIRPTLATILTETSGIKVAVQTIKESLEKESQRIDRIDRTVLRHEDRLTALEVRPDKDTFLSEPEVAFFKDVYTRRRWARAEVFMAVSVLVSVVALCLALLNGLHAFGVL